MNVESAAMCMTLPRETLKKTSRLTRPLQMYPRIGPAQSVEPEKTNLSQSHKSLRLSMPPGDWKKDG